MSRKYVIINTSEINTVDFTQVLQTSEKTLRYTSDGSKFLLKYEGTQPSSISGKVEYSNNEITTLLNDINGDWYTDPTE